MANQIGSRLSVVWDACVLIAITLSIVLVSLGLVFPGILAVGLLLLYGLDLVCWADLLKRQRQNTGHFPQKTGWLLLLLTAPWELVLPSFSIVENALPLLWALRLLRVAQLNIFLRHQELLSQHKSGVLRLMRLLVNITLAGHCLACGWLLLGHMNLESSWIARESLPLEIPESQYIRALYWTIATMTTVGYGDITPVLDREYLYACFVMLVGASFYAYIIGNVASLVGELNAGKAEYQQRAQFVTNYLHEQNVPAKLVNRVQAYYLNRWTRYRNYNEDELLSDLPRPLALEIKTELASRFISEVPIFKYASQVIREKLLASLELEFIDPGSVIARDGERNQKLIFVIDGQLDVQFEGELVDHFGPGDYFGNYSLILDEPRTASVVANSYCELMYLHKDSYEQIKQLYPEFVEVMKKAMSDNSEKMSDLVLKGVVL